MRKRTYIIVGAGAVLLKNAPEIRDTIKSGAAKAWVGTATYIALETSRRAVGVWLLGYAVRLTLQAAKGRAR